ncbi:Pentapeptide repeat [Trema orientale]|uniref:Pentapeptide repeat n=1 Tax=Trema orientale TaxID=63057 RepID=A0A2P5CX67_TREOI|nr:Pentapeptide repeat [Trema orientale]
MAFLNVSLFSPKLPPKLPLSHPHPHFSSLPCYPAPLVATLRTPPPPATPSLASSVVESVSKASLLALLSASLLLVDPALAFKGGGPYGSEVTRGQDLTGKDFSGKSLIKQDFKTSILRQAKFKGATLLGASFFDADLTGADLSDADLRGADFSLANVTKDKYLLVIQGLSSASLYSAADHASPSTVISNFQYSDSMVHGIAQMANLSNANLEGALATGNTSFRGSNITGADFTDVPLRDDQREYLCKIADGVNSTTGNATRDTLLCN